MTTALTVIDGRVTAPEAWQEIKSDALVAATMIESVTDNVSHDHAVAVQSDLTSARRFLEKSRVELKAPYLATSKLIDSMAKKEDEELATEERRVATMVGDYQSLELAKVRAANNARRMEEEQIEKEKQAVLRQFQEDARLNALKIIEAEAAALRAAQQASNAEEVAKAAELQREIERQKALADAESHERMDAINEQFAAKVADLPVVDFGHRADDQRVTVDWDIVVTDIWLLARAHPACVKIEPRLAEIKTMLKAGVKVGGVMAKEIVKSTTTTRKAIDV